MRTAATGCRRTSWYFWHTALDTLCNKRTTSDPGLLIRSMDNGGVSVPLWEAEGAVLSGFPAVSQGSTVSLRGLSLLPSRYPPTTNSHWRLRVSLSLFSICLPLSLRLTWTSALIPLPLRLCSVNAAIVRLSCFDMFSLRLYSVVLTD